jgi:nicotinate-nucleotide pyrophosphorylase (carboxylating)
MSVYSAPWYTPAVQRLLDLALEEDVGRGDVTTSSVIDETQEAEGDITAGERLVVCGLGVVEAVFTRFDWRTRVRMKVADGDPVAPTTTVATVRGPAAALLAGERTALNFLQRLSGIATLTQTFVAAAEGAKLRITDTRKTMPGARALEKYAVRIGGGANHRADLSSGILIKDNHVALCGSVREAVRRARLSAPHGLRIGVEVDTLAQLEEAIEAGAEVVLLDNFATRDLIDAVRRVRDRAPRIVLEASGGVTRRAPSIFRSRSVPPNRCAPSTAERAGVAPTFEALDADRIARTLTTRWLGRPCVCLPTCASTNDVAAERGRAGAGEGLVVLAESQSGGRGRLGRSWHSPAGANLTFSVLLRPARPPFEVPPLTLLAGAAVAEALATLGVVPRLKWPNDVQLVPRSERAQADEARPGDAWPSQARPGEAPPSEAQPKKIAGILTEMASEGDRVGHVVVGIGINVNDTALPPDLAGRATSLALATGRTFDRTDVLARVLRVLEQAYDDFRANGTAAAVRWWAKYGALGARCRVRIGERELDGVTLGIDPDGALRVAGDDGHVHRVVSGEIT